MMGKKILTLILYVCFFTVKAQHDSVVSLIKNDDLRIIQGVEADYSKAKTVIFSSNKYFVVVKQIDNGFVMSKGYTSCCPLSASVVSRKYIGQNDLLHEVFSLNKNILFSGDEDCFFDEIAKNDYAYWHYMIIDRERVICDSTFPAISNANCNLVINEKIFNFFLNEVYEL